MSRLRHAVTGMLASIVMSSGTASAAHAQLTAAAGFCLFERDDSGAVVRLVHWRDNNPVVWRRW